MDGAGTIPGDGPAHEAILTIVDGAVAGTVRQGGRLWQVRTVVPGAAAAPAPAAATEEGAPGVSAPGAGEQPTKTPPGLVAANGAVVALVAIDEAAFPPDDAVEAALRSGAPGPPAAEDGETNTPPPVEPSPPSTTGNDSDPSAVAAAAAPLIRVQFLYTAATRDALGGDAQARALAAHSVDLANAGLANSGVPASSSRFQWTGYAAVVPEARESDGWFTLRNRLAAPADGWADWATGKERINGKADVTVMFVNLIDLCGLAAGIGREAATPAPVVLVSHVCVAKHSVLHEVRMNGENGEMERERG